MNTAAEPPLGNDKPRSKIKENAMIALFVGVIVGTVILGILFLNDKDIFARLTIEWLVIPVVILGGWGILLLFGIITLETVLMPIPSEIILLMTGVLWGIPLGATLGTIGSVFAATMAYTIASRGGRPVVEKAVGKKMLEPIDNLIKRYGTWFIFTMRAIPLMAFDPISYASGLLKVDFKKYIIATMIGSVPRALFYALLGSFMLAGAEGDPMTWTTVEHWQAFLANESEFEAFANSFNIILFTVVGILVGSFLVYNFVLNPYLIKKGKQVTTVTREDPSNEGKTPVQ